MLPSFGRRLGRKLTPHKQALMDELLPRYVVELPAGEGEAMSLAFAQGRKLALEIGFGGGEHILHKSGVQPDWCFIGAEPYIPGVAKLLSQLTETPRDNVRLFTDDVRLLMQHLPDACLDCVYILFPDPWPKPRHFKRRLIQTAFLDELARLIKPEGILFLATDHRDYSLWMLERVLAHDAFAWTARTVKDWADPPLDWAQTRYEYKTSAQGREPVFLRFLRQ